MVEHRNICWIGMLLLATFLSSCTPCVVREAQTVIAQADSLRQAGQMYGIDAGDSVTLAQAYETLGSLSLFNFHFSPSYVRACYYYGRLLREKDDPVAAMQVFINATHSRTRDYHILGRVYSNMGSICMLGENYSLASEMFRHSSDMFLLQGDSILYFYGLNNMAFNLAESGEKEEALAILEYITDQCNNMVVITKTWEAKAELYRVSMQYDSAIYCVNRLQSYGYDEPTGILIKAQAFSLSGEKDSALLYAQKILEDTRSSCQDRFNSLYIITHFDTTLCASDISELASQREDIRYYEYEPEKERMSKAIQVLQQDLTRKPDVRWLYAMIITACLIGGVSYWRYRNHQKKIQHEMGKLAEHRTEVITQSIKQHIDTTDLEHTLHWKKYDRMKVDADLYMGGIVSQLETRKLNETEIRFCVLTILDFSLSHIAEIIHYGYPSGIKTLKKRISVKLDTTPQNLRIFLLRLAANA